ncbi:MAG TPA: redoxin domain-containing protein [Aestuariivirgaceae bacterium]|nr:redoxin domain-containing protein [Aestuariivirgaceae bacterium]
MLLAMMRGLYCAFCRRHIAQLSTTRQKLQALGVEALVIVAMNPERVRLYYRYRPLAVPLAADPELITHRAYGVPQPALTPEILQAVESRHIDLAHRLQIQATDLAGIKSVLCQQDNFVPVESELKDRRDWLDRHGGQMIGQFLVDRDGIVRWVNIEGAKDGLDGLEKFPTDEEFVAAASRFVA